VSWHMAPSCYTFGTQRFCVTVGACKQQIISLSLRVSVAGELLEELEEGIPRCKSIILFSNAASLMIVGHFCVYGRVSQLDKPNTTNTERGEPPWQPC